MEALVRRLRVLDAAIPNPEAYPFNLPAVRTLFEREELPLHPAVTFLVGENGSGKSTLIEAIAVAAGFNAEGGTKNFSFGTRPSHSVLHQHIALVRGTRRLAHGFFLRAESLFNVATAIEDLDAEPAPTPKVIDSYGGRSLHEQSHGESFLAVVEHGFRPGGFFVLDEPEAALSPQRQLALLGHIHALVRTGAQFVIATHSPILMAFPEAQILQIGADGIESVAYEDTDHVRLTRGFLNAPERYLRPLFEAD